MKTTLKNISISLSLCLFSLICLSQTDQTITDVKEIAKIMASDYASLHEIHCTDMEDLECPLVFEGNLVICDCNSNGSTMYIDENVDEEENMEIPEDFKANLISLYSQDIKVYGYEYFEIDSILHLYCKYTEGGVKKEVLYVRE
jgi:hypothetical protein